MNPLLYDEVRSQIRNGDILLCRASSLMGQVIAEVTQSQYTHATLAGWMPLGGEEDIAMLGETREGHGSRLIALSTELARFPGYYDWFRPRYSRYCRRRAWSFMARAAGNAYGWRHIARTWLRRRLGTWVPPLANSDDPCHPRDCSALVHTCLRLAGHPRLTAFDADVVPGDLADTAHFEYLGTLFTDPAQIAYAQGLVYET